jgi:hypothetical protein
MSSCTINLNSQAFLHHNAVSRHSEILAAVRADIARTVATTSLTMHLESLAA